MLSKVPPHSIEAEQGVLGSILLDKDGILKISSVVSPLDFYEPRNSIVYEVMLELLSKNRPIDLLTVRELLDDRNQLEEVGGNKFLVSLTNSIFTSSNIYQYAQIIKHKSVLRKLIKAGNDILLCGYDENADITDTVNDAMDSIQKIGTESITKETAVTTDGFYDEYSKHIERMNRGEKVGFDTGIRVLDEYCDGLQPWTVMRLNAYSNIGKTRMAIFVLANLLKQGISCVFYSTEVTAAHFFPIYASTVLGLSFKDVKEGKVDIDWDYLNSLPFTFYQDKYSLNEIIFSAKKHKPQVVMIDFCQNIDAGHMSDEYKNMSLYAREIQKFAITNNIAVFDLSQVSNEGAKVGSSSNVIASKGSGALVASADVGLLLTRESFTPEATILKLDIKKNKYGPLASTELCVDYRNSNYQEFKE